ncbi:MAG: DJ-1/PfpI family protein [Deltaproteobacteria bacterium]|nr:DJ-1/PfpI family protein [Deltaproteobacteria bacterium]
MTHLRRCRVLRAALLVLAFLAPPTLAGIVTLYCRLQGTDLLDPAAIRVPAPAPRLPATAKRLAVIVAGNRGTEITDTLPLLELLEESEAFEVRVVAPERTLSPFKSSAIAGSGLDFYPDLSFADYAEFAGDRTPDLIVIPYLTAWRTADAAVVPWIRAHAGPATTVLSICAGAEVAAATGLFDGHEATAHAPLLAPLADRHPEIRYRGDVRWVRDGRRISSGTLTAGLDATLAAIDALAGRAAALRAAAATGYRHVRFLDDPSSPTTGSRLGIALETAFRWERTRVAVVVEDGVSETSLAAALDVPAATMTTDGIAVAATLAPIRTRNGFRVMPRDDDRNLGRYDAVVRPAALAGYDRAVEQLASTHGGPMARVAARLMNYPVEDLELGGGPPVGVTMALRALLLGAAGVVLARLLMRSCPDRA